LYQGSFFIQNNNSHRKTRSTVELRQIYLKYNLKITSKFLITITARYNEPN